MTRRLSLARVVQNRGVARDTVILTLAVQLDSVPRPGQFAMVHPGHAGCLLPRPFSILDYRDGELDLLVKEVGKGSRALAASTPGEEIRVFGPLGRGFEAPELTEYRAIFVAGGVGVVPLHWLARQLESSTQPHCIFGARTPGDLPRSLLAEYAPGWELWVEESPDEDCQRGLVTEGLLRALERFPDAAVAVCGPTPMMKTAARLCRQRSRPLWVCLEEQMGCGAGVCRACVIPAADGSCMRTVCKEGPVFAIDEIQYAIAADEGGA